MRDGQDGGVDSPFGSHWFEPLATHMGSAYLRYSFTKGTVQECDALVDLLDLQPSQRILDVGCGPGRHAHELARRGMLVHGVDISQTFIDLAIEQAVPGATFERADARQLNFAAEFDAVICLCQGAFGLMTASGHDRSVLAGMSAAVVPGGSVVVSAFSSYFVVKHWAEADFDADTGVNHEHTEVKDQHGQPLAADLWTGCYTPRELRLLAVSVGLEPVAVYSVEPGSYQRGTPTVDTAEFLLHARRL
jgi:SAM-dependent methyltransferase